MNRPHPPSIKSPRKPFFNMGGEGFALFEHPVFQIELFADDLKSLIEEVR
jgi:hypothetical protein